MYEALVARVRYHIQKANFMGLKEAESTLLLNEAADAIEELSREIDIDNATMTAMDAAIPRWIPVTERLPEDGKFVLVCNDDGHMMIAKHETETYEWYYKYTNYDFDIWDNEEQGPVRYWMSLPQPPKEEI